MISDGDIENYCQFQLNTAWRQGMHLDNNKLVSQSCMERSNLHRSKAWLCWRTTVSENMTDGIAEFEFCLFSRPAQNSFILSAVVTH